MQIKIICLIYNPCSPLPERGVAAPRKQIHTVFSQAEKGFQPRKTEQVPGMYQVHRVHMDVTKNSKYVVI